MVELRIKMADGCDDLFPTKAHEDDAAWDISSAVNISIRPFETVVIPTGIFADIPKGYFVKLVPRSGLSRKYPLRLVNSPATIDSSYTGEWGIIMQNLSNDVMTIQRGMRLVQMIVEKLPEVTLVKVDKIEKDTTRGADGFGSSGV